VLADVDVNGTTLHYREAGAGSETVVMSHSYLVDHRQFERQIDALSTRYRVLAFDHRDHGGSALALGDYDLSTLVDDTEQFLHATEAVPCHFVGLSTGGFVGLRLALRSPELFSSLTLMDTSAQSEPRWARLKYEVMLAALRTIGFRPVIGSAMRVMFSDTFLHDRGRQEDVATWRERMMQNDPQGLTRFGRAIFSRDDVLDRLGALTVPTLVIVGQQDRAFDPSRSEAMAAAIPGARLEVVDKAGHLSSIEQPEQVAALLESFVAANSGGGS
jgi:pimeloyl-ACP methyl ester carboxylesterase